MVHGVSGHGSAYRPGIDGLRALAVLLVVIYHAFPQFLTGGYVGVDVFFVISGYLITRIILTDMEQGRFSFAGFYARRIRRLFPALITVLTFCLLVAVACVLGAGFFVMLTDEFKQFMLHMATGAGFVANIQLWREAGYFDLASESKPLLHLWSLGIEEQFYLLWPALLLVLVKARKLLVPVLVVLIVVSFLLNVWLISEGRIVAAFYSPLTRFWELWLGAVLAVCFKPQSAAARAKPVTELLAFAGLLFIVLAAVLYNKSMAYPGTLAALPVVGAVLVLAMEGRSQVLKAVLANRLMVGIGLISYPLYLWHWPLLAGQNMLSLGQPSPSVSFILLALSFLLAWLTYLFIERPLRFGGHVRLKVTVLCFAMLGLVGIGLVGGRLQGVASRFPVLGQYLPVAQFSTVRDWREHRCFLQPEDEAKSFAPECTEQTGKPLLVLWGDSHAAALYPAIAALQGVLGVDVAQFTRSACPPYVDAGAGDEACATGTLALKERLAALQPQVVVLHAKWGENHDAERLRSSIRWLKQQGTAHILLVGPVPHWSGSLPQAMLVHRLTSGHLPERLQTGLLPDAALRDAELRTLAADEGVAYHSLYNSLCNASGCLAYTDADVKALVSLDYGHLTPSAARFIAPELGETLKPLSGDKSP